MFGKGVIKMQITDLCYVFRTLYTTIADSIDYFDDGLNHCFIQSPFDPDTLQKLNLSQEFMPALIEQEISHTDNEKILITERNEWEISFDQD